MNKLIEKINILIKSLNSQNKNEVFDYIWKNYYKRLIYFLNISLSNKDKIEDMAQDIMIKIYNNLDKYNFNFSFNTWFFSIARNHCIDYLKKKNIQFEEYNEENIINNLNIEDNIIKNELISSISQIINNFSEINKQIYFLYFYENQTYKEISKIMNIPIGTVKYKIFEIKKEIKIKIKEDFE